MASDNIAETSASGLKLVFLAPGMVIQWFTYMSVGNLRTYGQVRQQTRLSRSPIMTWVYAILFWAVVVLFGIVSLVEEFGSAKETPSSASTASLQRNCVELVLQEGKMDRASATAYCADYYQ